MEDKWYLLKRFPKDKIVARTSSGLRLLSPEKVEWNASTGWIDKDSRDTVREFVFAAGYNNKE